jgi:hypothetical protein
LVGWLVGCTAGLAGWLVGCTTGLVGWLVGFFSVLGLTDSHHMLYFSNNFVFQLLKSNTIFYPY